MTDYFFFILFSGKAFVNNEVLISKKGKNKVLELKLDSRDGDQILLIQYRKDEGFNGSVSYEVREVRIVFNTILDSTVIVLPSTNLVVHFGARSSNKF